MNGISSDQDVMGMLKIKLVIRYLQSALHFETKHFILDYLRRQLGGISTKNGAIIVLVMGGFTVHLLNLGMQIGTKEQADTMEQLLEPTSKFILQLQKLFANETVDLNLILQRINAAFKYFGSQWMQWVESLLWKLQETQYSRNPKVGTGSYPLLEELQTKAVLRLVKHNFLVATVVAGKLFLKKKLTSPEIKIICPIKLKK